MIDPTDRLTVTLTAETWNVVMRVLSEGAYRVVAPVINDIQTQCNNQQTQATQVGPRLVDQEDIPA